jgi:hypothetical protein
MFYCLQTRPDAVANLEVYMIATTDSPALNHLRPLRQLAAQLRSRILGKRIHVATLYRWTDRGLRGQRLRYVQVGNTRCSTVAWVHEFFAALADKCHGDAPAPTTPSAAPLATRTRAARRKAIEAADRELERMGI